MPSFLSILLFPVLISIPVLPFLLLKPCLFPLLFLPLVPRTRHQLDLVSGTSFDTWNWARRSITEMVV